MVQFGVELRQEREHRGVSLEAMCAFTKLSLRQLLDVEAGNFRELPGGIFRKGFVRSYLKALDLDEPLWLERFEASYRASGLADAAEVEWGDFAANVRNNRLGGKDSGTRNRWLGVLAMTILLLLLSLCVWKFVIVPSFRHMTRRLKQVSPGLVLGTMDRASLHLAGEAFRKHVLSMQETRYARIDKSVTGFED